MALRVALKFMRNSALYQNVKSKNVPRHYFCTEASTATAQTPPPPIPRKVPHVPKKVIFFFLFLAMLCECRI